MGIGNRDDRRLALLDQSAERPLYCAKSSGQLPPKWQMHGEWPREKVSSNERQRGAHVKKINYLSAWSDALNEH